MNQPLDPKKLSSIEAAALYLSNGTTSDPNEAVHYDEATELNLDALQRSHLRRMMGFDFGITVREKKLSVYSKQEPYVTSWCGYSGQMDDKALDKLVSACLRLKNKYDAVKIAEAKQ